MNTQDEIVKVYTGGELIINRIKQELESRGIFCLIKDGYGQGIQAGFVGGVSSAIDLFVRESDLDEAIEVVKAITEV
ncbi:MAG: putative signal transducing protein [Draconibacterium sp.]